MGDSGDGWPPQHADSRRSFHCPREALRVEFLMRTIAGEMTSRRKIRLIFALGIVGPSLVVGYLSWNAVAKRREALRRIVESQLWTSGERAVRSVEASLQDHEQAILSADRFLLSSGASKDPLGPPSMTTETGERVFLLDSEFRVVFPIAGGDESPYVQWGQALSGSPFVALFERAEYWAFVRKDYDRAAGLYRRCGPQTEVVRLKAFAWEGLGRCLFFLGRDDEATSVYAELFERYGQLKNRSGHPYGPLAALQLYEIAKRQGRPEDALERLVQAFEMLQGGAWGVNRSIHDFYAEEIAEALREGFSGGTRPDLQGSYESVRSRSSPYLEELEFASLVEESIVPIIKDKIAYSRYANEPPAGRFPLTVGASRFLISYARLADIPNDRFFYAGFSWNLEDVKSRLFPGIAAGVERDGGVRIRLIEPGDPGSPPSDPVVSENALTMAGGAFPFPWRYVVSRSDIEDLERAAQVENLLVGVLLACLVGLMSFGAYLLVRDVSRQAETSAVRSRFIDNISHELKTPLTLIRLYAETLKNQRHLPEERRREAYEIITGESERLSNMIRNVLDMSRIERDALEFHFQSGSIAETVKSTLESYRHHLDKRGFAVREDIEGEIPPVCFDREAMASVVVNLLSNAVKFSPGLKDVSIKVFRRGQEAVLQVADRGIGIPSREAGRIFERFYRSPNAAGPDPGGSGLGLTIVKHIVEAHGGRIAVESEPGHGSVFSVFLPLENPGEGRR
jgi:signal transduction histidine kinase/tetratricopeptide (TPR) repeat protein